MCRVFIYYILHTFCSNLLQGAGGWERGKVLHHQLAERERERERPHVHRASPDWDITPLVLEGQSVRMQDHLFGVPAWLATPV